MENNICIVGVRNFDGESYVEYEEFRIKSFQDTDNLEKLQKDFERLDKKNKALQDKNNALKYRISELESELEREKNCYLKMDEKFLWMKSNDAKYIYENNELKAEIQRLKEKCGEASEDTDKSCASGDTMDYEKLCHELQYQHQQDCILINNLNVTIDKLVDRYANLRKNMGMD